MRAILLAAGVGNRLGEAGENLPKCLLEFGGKSLLRRRLDMLEYCGIRELVIAVGFRSEQIAAALSQIDAKLDITLIFNPDYRQGSIVTLWTVRDQLISGGDVVLMDADVLCDRRMLERLLSSTQRNCFLLDRHFAPGDEPVKLCIRDGVLVEFRKKIEVDYDYWGESVGFFRFSESMARRLATFAARYRAAGRDGESCDEAIRDVLLAQPEEFWFEDVTGLPWIEIDFAEDVVRARDKILPRLEELPARDRQI